MTSISSFLLVLPFLYAPEESTPPNEAAKSEVVAVTMNTAAGTKSYVPGKWGMLSVELINPSDVDRDIQVNSYFAQSRELQSVDTDLEYCRKIWLPAHSRRLSWYTMKIPEPNRDLSQNGPNQSVSVESYLSADSRGGKHVSDSKVEKETNAGILHLNWESSVAALISPDEPTAATEVRDLVRAMRIGSSRSARMTQISGPFLPPTLNALETLDQLVIANDRIARDSAGLTAIRRWLHRGGSLWIMLDQVDSSTVELLLGESFDSHVVDRVSLTEVKLESTANLPDNDQERSFEIPIDFVRVVPGDVEVLIETNGWPAAFVQSIGRGRVLFTTLGPRAWMRLPRQDEQLQSQELRQLAYLPVDALTLAGDRHVAPPDTPSIDPSDLEPYLTNQIGYQVVSRTTVMIVLGLFCLTLIVAGVWLNRRQQLEQLALISVIGAVLAAIVLVSVGFRSKTRIGDTLAMVQFVESVPDSDDAVVSGLMMLYQTEPKPTLLMAESDGTFHPELTGLHGTWKRMLRSDLNKWTLRPMARSDLDERTLTNLKLPSGMRSIPFRFSTKLKHPTRAHLKFGPDGVQGTILSSSLEDVADALVVLPGKQWLPITLDGKNQFQIGAGSIVDSRTFIGANLLSDEQGRRQSIYRSLLSDTGYSQYRQPTLFVWAKPFDSKFQIGDGTKQIGSALIEMPIVFDQTPADTRVVVPSAFMHYRAELGKAGEFVSLGYQNRQAEWTEVLTGSRTWLRFQIPNAVRPIRVERISLRLDIHAPFRAVDIVAKGKQERISLVSLESPIGVTKEEFDASGQLAIDDDGGLLIGIFVGDSTASSKDESTGQTLQNPWRVRSVQLELEGTVLQREE